MQSWRHGRGFGRVAALVLCCLLAADVDADARRAHHLRAPRAAATKSEFTGKPNPPGPLRFADTRLEPVAWSNLEGWAADDHAAAYAAFRASCRALTGAVPSRQSATARQKTAAVPRDTRPIHAPLVEICHQVRGEGTLGEDAARKFFE